jgi:hypothetical protein
MKRKSAKTSKPPRAVPLTQAEFLKADLSSLMRLYHQLSRSIEGLSDLTDYGEPLDLMIQNHIAAPLERILFALHRVIKAFKPKNPHIIETRALLLYQHALRFDASDQDRRLILCEGLLAIPVKPGKTKVERVGNVEVHTVKQGNRIISRGYRTISKGKAAKA